MSSKKFQKYPLVSVIIPTYDSLRTVKRCLESIRKQTYPNIEIVVIDSRSYDPKRQEKSRKIIKKYAKLFVDGPERSIQRNRGTKEAKGEYLLVIDQDMYLSKNVVKDCYQKINKENLVAINIPEISIGVGYWTKCVALERYVSNVLENGLNESCRFFRRKDALEIGGYDPEVVGVEDSDFHYRMLKLGKIGKIKSKIYHDEGRTSFFNRVKKKYYYSKSFRKYLAKNPNVAVKQFFPLKSAYLKHWKVFAQNPTLTPGVIVLRATEVAAGFMGIILNR